MTGSRAACPDNQGHGRPQFAILMRYPFRMNWNQIATPRSIPIAEEIITISTHREIRVASESRGGTTGWSKNGMSVGAR